MQKLTQSKCANSYLEINLFAFFSNSLRLFLSEQFFFIHLWALTIGFF